jgi:SAM-dependent methyltransferase
MSRVELRRGEMSMGMKSFYQQSGVAMTCRSYEEYVSMFDLDGLQLQGKRVLDVSGGASSFTAEAALRGILTEASDPLYVMSPKEIGVHGMEEIKLSSSKLAGLQHLYNWDYYVSIERHQAGRERSLGLFLENYSSTDSRARYHTGSLPELPFKEGTFSLVLCSHFLFLYEEQFDYAFHLAALKELLRICKKGGEARIYPLLNFRTEPYGRLDELLRALEEEGADVQLLDSKLPFLPNSKQFLQIIKR